jgi:hypothetical protein
MGAICAARGCDETDHGDRDRGAGHGPLLLQLQLAGEGRSSRLVVVLWCCL